MTGPPASSPILPLPQWAYVPGEMAEDDADHATLWKAKSLVPSRFRDYVPARHPALRYGLTLNDRGYFWESQEVLKRCGPRPRKEGASASCCAPASWSPKPICASWRARDWN